MEQEKYIALIFSKLNNTIETKEIELLENWLKESTINQTLFEETKNVWEKTNAYKTTFKPNESIAWEKIQRKLENKGNSLEKEAKVVPIKRFSFLKIASVIVLLLASGFFMKNYFASNEFTSITTASNETKSIVLPDGSTVSLNENSKIKYANNFSERNVTLQGEAFFEVAKDKNNPFSIKTRYTETTVLGTSFNIDANNEDEIKVALITGKIKFKTAKNAVVLNPGEKISYNNYDQSIQLVKKGTENEMAWKTNILVFDNTAISKVVSILENHYDTKIVLKEKTELACSFSGTFENEKIEKIIEAISYSFNTRYTFKNNQFNIDSLTCLE